ncbi:Uncharacterised protein [uncultured archaeon]|nr:Uncharacterised protein [uncultured archaeon]
MKGSVKLQSAMEYLTTYGWAILVIVAVLLGAYQLGIFNGPNGGNSCLATSGFVCKSPVLSTNGLLTLSIGQAVTPQMTVHAINCTSSKSSTGGIQTLVGDVVLPKGGNLDLSVSCPVGSSALGSKFSGTLWIVMGTGASQTTSLLASLSVKSTRSTS